MATLVCFHAHPDDEAIATGGVMAQAASVGHRVVLVVATDGALGFAPKDPAPGETTAQRRSAELQASAEVLGAHRVEQLGYGDSGMDGDPANEDPSCFWQTDVEAAAQRLAAILREEAADVLTIYDDHGGYGHPDHIQVHRVGLRAAELAGTPRVLQSTMNRDEIIRRMTEAIASGAFDPSGDATEVAVDTETVDPETAGGDAEDSSRSGPPDLSEMQNFGSPESIITTAVDVRAWAGHKRRAMAAHGSQIAADSWFLSMDDEVFAGAFGTEWFIEATAGPGTTWCTGLFENPLPGRPD